MLGEPRLQLLPLHFLPSISRFPTRGERSHTLGSLRGSSRKERVRRSAKKLTQSAKVLSWQATPLHIRRGGYLIMAPFGQAAYYRPRCLFNTARAGCDLGHTDSRASGRSIPGFGNMLDNSITMPLSLTSGRFRGLINFFWYLYTMTNKVYFDLYGVRSLQIEI